MRIGIDIDGVLTDVEQYQLAVCSKYVYEFFDKGITDGEAYDTADIFALTKEEDEKLWDICIPHYSTKEKARAFASEVIKKLKYAGNQIYIITARTNTDRDDVLGEKTRNIVKKWLKDNDIVYDKIIFSSEDKLDACLENKIDLMIEDKVENIEKISKVIPVICFNASYNKRCQGKNIIRCYSWYDIYGRIKH